MGIDQISMAMLIWQETINGILCCFGGNTDKLYVANLYQWSSLIRIFYTNERITPMRITPVL